MGIAVEFVLDHLREVARALFMRRVQPVVDAIDARIEILKKEMARLGGSSRALSFWHWWARSFWRSDSIDDDVVLFPFFAFLLLLCHP